MVITKLLDDLEHDYLELCKELLSLRNDNDIALIYTQISTYARIIRLIKMRVTNEASNG